MDEQEMTAQTAFNRSSELEDILEEESSLEDYSDEGAHSDGYAPTCSPDSNSPDSSFLLSGRSSTRQT